MTTPLPTVPRLSATMSSMVGIDASERVLAEQLQAALAPSFVLIRRLGQGGMGIVYLARDPALKRLVAVKLMSPESAADPDARARFEREAESVAAISHPNVVAVYSVGELPSGIPYMVMQYVEGPSMAERLKDEGPLDLESAKQILGQVASALEAAHRKGIIHRDIKAANVLWDERQGRALVSDFGIAAIHEPAYERGDPDRKPLQITQTGMVVGTPRYMSPEQLLSEPVTEKTDIYSLGLLGYELLTGEGPYQVTSPHEIIAAHLRDAPRPISVMRPDVDPTTESLLNICLAKDKDARPSAGEIARRLAHGSSTLLEWPPPGLEEVHGAAVRPIDQFLIGALAVSIPLVVQTTSSRLGWLRLGWPEVLILPMIGAGGALTMIGAVAKMIGLLRQATHGAKAGYGWGTIAEVVVDEKRDTGALITGEREYATLSVEGRNALRRGRVVATAARLAAGLWSIGGFFVLLPMGRFLGPSLVATLTLGLSAVLLSWAGWFGRRERLQLRAARKRAAQSKTALERLSGLATSWRDSFRAAIGLAGRSEGAVGGARRRFVIGVVAAVLSIVALGAAYALITLSVLSEATDTAHTLRATSVRTKANQVRRIAFLRPSVDPTITPLRAGQALRSITSSGETAIRDERPIERPIAKAIAGVEMSGGPAFGRTWLDGVAIKAAAKGLSPGQRSFLAGIADQPGLDEFAVLSRARLVDYMGATMAVPHRAILGIWELPLPRYSRLKSLAYGNVARAALALDRGDKTRAEALLREDIGVGFGLLQSPLLLENLIGVAIAQRGRVELAALYEVTGRAADARAITAQTEVAEDASVNVDAVSMKPADRQAYYQAIIRDSVSLRGLRWELVHNALAWEPCSDLRQVLFGPDSLHLARLAEARKALVSTPGEALIMELSERTLDQPVSFATAGIPISIGTRSLMAFARTVDLMTRSHRMQACTARIVVNGLSE